MGRDAAAARHALEGRVSRYGYWIRLDASIADDAFVRQCALAFVSDAAPSRAARSPHPDSVGDMSDRGRFQGASLDHACGSTARPMPANGTGST